MLITLFLAAVLASALRGRASTPLGSNLAYKSPFSDHPQVSIPPISFVHDLDGLRTQQFGLDEDAIHKRHVEVFRRLEKRQTVDASGFNDDHYPTFYGGDFSNVSQTLFKSLS
jgi:alkaline phosphatase D